MSDQPVQPTDPRSDADPLVAAALRTLQPPPHGDDFWELLSRRLAAEPRAHAPGATDPPASPPLPPAPAPPVLAEVVPLSAPRRTGSRWWAAAAALLAVALGIAALSQTSTTNVTTRPAGTSSVPVDPSTEASTTPSTDAVTAPTTAAVRPDPVRPAVPTSGVSRRTTSTTRPASFSLSPAGVGPLRLGMTPQQAGATGALGTFLPSGNGSCGMAKSAGPYQGDFSTVFLNGKLAVFYVLPGSRLRTPQGIGIGSPLAKLASIPGTRVDSPEKYGAGTNVDITSGNTGYQFRVDSGTVQGWSVGTTEGLALTEGCA